MNSDIKFYWTLFKRRFPVMFALFLIAAAIGVGISMTLSPRYSATARLLVESPQIPDELAASTVRLGSTEQLQIIEQRLLTRANLIDIANKFELFRGRRLTPDAVVDQLLAHTDISTSSGRERATLMEISFSWPDARLTAAVVNEYVTLILREDAARRQALASQTLDFFQQEVERLDQELSRRSADIVAFKAANKDALPEEMGYRLDRQAQLQERLNTAARDRVALNEQRTRLIALGSASLSGGQPVLSPLRQEIRNLEEELSDALTIYSATNPRVKVLQARLDRLKARLETDGDTEGEAPAEDPAQTLLNLQMGEIDTRLGFLDEEVRRVERELGELREAIAKTPENAIRLEELEREYEIAEGLYNRAVDALEKAQTGERIEVLSKGERVSVIEQATVPTEPDGRLRIFVAGGGIFLGVALAVMFFVLTELLNRAVRRPADLVRALDIQPLATIPFIETERSRRRRRAGTTIVIGAIAIGVPIALWAVHQFYLPLDLIAERALRQLGL